MLSASTLALVSLLAIAFVGLFFRWFYAQHLHSADAIEDWGHAYVIPLISGWVIWNRRDALARAPKSTFWPAVVPFVLGIVCYFFFVVGVPNHLLQGLAMIGTLMTLVLLLLGPRVFRVLVLPLSYLVFAVTLPEQVMIKITFPLQLIASKGAWFLMSLFAAVAGYTVDVDGNTLSIITSNGTTHPLNVAEACSGMRMLIAFIALAGAVALISCPRWWERAAVVLIAVPVAVLMNIFRVAVLGWLTLANPNFAKGETHMLIGTVLLVPALAAYMGLVWVLGRIIVDESARAPLARKAPA